MHRKFQWLLVTVGLGLLAGCPMPAQATVHPLQGVVKTAATAQMGNIVAVAAPLNSVPATATAEPTTAPSPTHTSETSKAKPNIVFVLADDLDSAEMQYMPKLKALIAAQGVTFRNYFVAMPLCCPSRASTLRGQYPHNTRIVGNQPPTGGFQKFFQLGLEKSTIAVWLQNARYRTMLAGKYLNGYPDKKNPLYIPPGWTEWYSPIKGRAYSEFNYTLNENGKPVAYGSKPGDYGTDVYVRKTVDFIQRSTKEGKPFFVYLAPYAPHAPYVPAPRHDALFLGLESPRTPNYNEADVSDKPKYIRAHALLTPKKMDYFDEVFVRRLQSLQAVDEGIEAIVNALKAAGQLDNTYIFFTSDNGFHIGNHRQRLGKTSPYEEELRVTMMVRGPGVPAGRTLEHLTGNIDLASTWADLAGAKAADFVDGRSLVPLLGARPPALNQWRRAFAIENGPDKVENDVTTTASPVTDLGEVEPPDEDGSENAPFAPEATLGIPNLRGVRLQLLSYVEYSTGEVELYNLEADPYQLQNLAATADPQLLKQLSARVRALATCKAAGCRNAENIPFNVELSKITNAQILPH